MKARIDAKHGKTHYEVQLEQKHSDKWIQVFALLAHDKIEDALKNAERMVTKTK